MVRILGPDEDPRPDEFVVNITVYTSRGLDAYTILADGCYREQENGGWFTPNLRPDGTVNHGPLEPGRADFFDSYEEAVAFLASWRGTQPPEDW